MQEKIYILLFTFQIVRLPERHWVEEQVWSRTKKNPEHEGRTNCPFFYLELTWEYILCCNKNKCNLIGEWCVNFASFNLINQQFHVHQRWDRARMMCSSYSARTYKCTINMRLKRFRVVLIAGLFWEKLW